MIKHGDRVWHGDQLWYYYDRHPESQFSALIPLRDWIQLNGDETVYLYEVIMFDALWGLHVAVLLPREKALQKWTHL